MIKQKTNRMYGNRKIEKHSKPVKRKVVARSRTERVDVVFEMDLYCVEHGEQVYEAMRELNPQGYSRIRVVA